MIGYNKSTAEMEQVAFPAMTAEVDAALHHSDFNFEHMHDYSNLDYDLINFSLGFEYLLSKDVVWTSEGEYTDLNDNEGYVYGIESGSMFMIRSGVRFEF